MVQGPLPLGESEQAAATGRTPWILVILSWARPLLPWAASARDRILTPACGLCKLLWIDVDCEGLLQEREAPHSSHLMMTGPSSTRMK